jgi:hypothetical protein
MSRLAREGLILRPAGWSLPPSAPSQSGWFQKNYLNTKLALISNLFYLSERWTMGFVCYILCTTPAFDMDVKIRPTANKLKLRSSALDLWHFGTDPDADLYLWLTDPAPDLAPTLFVSAVTFKTLTKIFFSFYAYSFLKLHFYHSSK